jgi:uncharacterized protein
MNMITHCRLHKQFAITVVLLFLVWPLARSEELPPSPTNYFNDYAGVITESTRKDLNARLAKFDKDTTNQVVVAIFPKMNSTSSLDDYTLRVVGQRGKNSGVALFVLSMTTQCVSKSATA